MLTHQQCHPTASPPRPQPKRKRPAFSPSSSPLLNTSFENASSGTRDKDQGDDSPRTVAAARFEQLQLRSTTADGASCSSNSNVDPNAKSRIGLVDSRMAVDSNENQENLVREGQNTEQEESPRKRLRFKQVVEEIPTMFPDIEAGGDEQDKALDADRDASLDKDTSLGNLSAEFASTSPEASSTSHPAPSGSSRTLLHSKQSTALHPKASSTSSSRRPISSPPPPPPPPADTTPTTLSDDDDDDDDDDDKDMEASHQDTNTLSSRTSKARTTAHSDPTTNPDSNGPNHPNEEHGKDDDDEDDGRGINGVGYRPTPAQSYARAQKRKQQVLAWRSREAREARERRSADRAARRGGGTNTSCRGGGGGYGGSGGGMSAGFGLGLGLGHSVATRKGDNIAAAEGRGSRAVRFL